MTDIMKKNTGMNAVFTVLAGAFAMGLCWSVRGSHGWGSSWGLLLAGFVFILFAVLAAGERKKLNYGQIALAAGSFMLTVPAWGTVLNSVTGILNPDNLDMNEEIYYVNPVSALFIMLCLGFGIAVVWGVLLGKAFSSKQWEIKDYIILLAVFFAVDLIAKASVSHWILKLVQPASVNAFQDGINQARTVAKMNNVPEQYSVMIKRGKELLKMFDSDATPYAVYMKKFANTAWAKKIPYGRNYFSQIDIISSAISAVAVLLADRFIIKDKRSANIGFAVSAAFAFSITVSDVLFYLGNGGYHKAHESFLPKWMPAWGTWEFFTGFIAGGIITLVLIKMKQQEDVEEKAFSFIPEKPRNIISFLLCMGFVQGINIVRPVIEKLSKANTVLMIAGIVISAVAAIGICVYLLKKYSVSLENLSVEKYASITLPALIILVIVYFLFVGTAEYQEFREMDNIVIWLDTIAAIAVVVWSILRNRMKKVS